jgi:cobalamin-dependent methionine synthase I
LLEAEASPIPVGERVKAKERARAREKEREKEKAKAKGKAKANVKAGASTGSVVTDSAATSSRSAAAGSVSRIAVRANNVTMRRVGLFALIFVPATEIPKTQSVPRCQLLSAVRVRPKRSIPRELRAALT